MAAPKRTKHQRERDLVEIARQYLAGRTQQEIAETLGLSRQQIGYDLQALLKRWQDQMLRDFQEHQAQELAKINEVEREYWREWSASSNDDKPGNPVFLRGVERCIERRCKLLGLNAPTKIAPTDPTGDKPYDPITDTERAARILAILDLARARKEREEAVRGAEEASQLRALTLTGDDPLLLKKNDPTEPVLTKMDPIDR